MVRGGTVWGCMTLVGLLAGCMGPGGTISMGGTEDGEAETVSGSDDPAASESGSAASDDSQGDSESSDESSSTSGAEDTNTPDGSSSSSETGTDTDEPSVYEPILQGYGTDSTFGADGEVCAVTTLAASGPGSLEDCVENRDTTDGSPTPRTVVFEVTGTIVLESSLSIRQPYLTIDGLTSKAPGITIELAPDGLSNGVAVETWPANDTCGHDVLLQGLRIRGLWTPDQGVPTAEDPPQAFGIDGENIPGCVHHVVFHRITVFGATDSGGDIWGSVSDVTFQHSAFLESYHPNTWSHTSSGEGAQRRERISAHHNLYARNHERSPQIRGDVRDLNFEQNVIHDWDVFGFPGGYATRIRCRDATCPQRLNFLSNHYTSTSPTLSQTVVLGDNVGPDDDESTIAAQVFKADNTLSEENVDHTTARLEFARPAIADVDIVMPEELAEVVLPYMGAPHRTDAEQAIFDDVAQTLTMER